jgi:hypothetical protein
MAQEKVQHPNETDFELAFLPQGKTNDQAARLQVFLATRQAVLNGELANGRAIESLTEAGWSVERARFHVDGWEVLSLMRLMHGERKSDPLRVVRLQVTDLEQMAKLLNIPDVSEEAYGEANDEAA